MADLFSNLTPGLESPAVDVADVTPNDLRDLPLTTRALNVATDGAVKITSKGGGIATVYVVAGIAFPVRATRIWQTGTTATGIVAMW